MTNTLTPVLFPTLLRVQQRLAVARAYLAAHPRLARALTWLAVLAVALIVMALVTHANAQTLNSVTDGTATKACTETKSLTANKWLKVFMVGGIGVAIIGVFRKQRDAWTNVIWYVVGAAVVGSLWNIVAVFGITC
ncbi:hypothetical protein [Deinococcus ruber]|uniref:Uncharacterized protein n=1 Tax=Deinococcus ruber TaxID=1848197 RepID=A0A918C7Z4_9DEIO|nr:hypothetical protein [Deinococcus ruber]GGR09752.1 hypothetical protein GCM10008957_23140 [Deinococcus ruber]